LYYVLFIHALCTFELSTFPITVALFLYTLYIFLYIFLYSWWLGLAVTRWSRST